MPAPIKEEDEREFAVHYWNTKDPANAYRLYKKKVLSDLAAQKGGDRMMKRPNVQKYLEEFDDKYCESLSKGIKLTNLLPDTERLVRKIALNEIELINQYAGTAALDHRDYYDDKGKAKQLDQLTEDQRMHIKDIIWSEPNTRGTRKVVDYILESRSQARDQLAKIMGIVNPQFDFAGVIALITGKDKEDVKDQVQRLNHSEGVNFEQIKERAAQIIDVEPEVLNESEN